MTHTWRPASIDAAPELDPTAVISGRAWADFCSALRRTGEKILAPELPATDLDRSTGLRHLLAMTQVGINQALAIPDATFPRLGPWRTDVYKFGHDCPDALYRSAALDGRSTYRVSGHVGSVRYLSFQTEGPEGTVDNRRSDQIAVGPDGRFELWIGAEPSGEGDWLRTSDLTDQLFVRQFFSDWEHEEPASMTIERVDDGTPAGPAPHPGRPERVAGQLAAVARWFDAITDYYIDREITDKAKWRNAFRPARTTDDAGGDRDNIMSHGHFDLEPDEALLIEVEPVPARYWSLDLANPWRESLDYAVRQTSLNDSQAVLDVDGRFRAVVAHTDPGTPNWLDTMGHTSGALILRWVVADRAPDPRCTVIPHSAIREHLPAETPVVSAAERAAVIARRRAQVARRFAA